MRFSVPQFIDVEDKIIGPLTLKQGIYMVGGVGITVFLFLKFGFFFAFLLGGPILFLSFLLAFIKIHGRPFIDILASAFFFTVKDKLYLWKKMPKKKNPTKPTTPTSPANSSQLTKPASVEMNQSKLKKLAWSLDTNNNFEGKEK